MKVLIEASQPPYEVRHNQVESIFLSAVDMYGHTLCHENLQVSSIPCRSTGSIVYNVIQTLTITCSCSSLRKVMSLQKNQYIKRLLMFVECIW